MATGIRVWDQAGVNLLVDTTTWCGQIIGSYSVPANHAAGSFTDARLALGRPFVFVVPWDSNVGATDAGNPVTSAATVSGTTINYTASNGAMTLIYGIY